MLHSGHFGKKNRKNDWNTLSGKHVFCTLLEKTFLGEIYSTCI